MIHSIEVSRTKWQIIVWSPIIIGLVIFSVFNSDFFIPKEYWQFALIGSVGGMLIGWGFGLAYSRTWKIKGIDN